MTFSHKTRAFSSFCQKMRKCHFFTFLLFLQKWKKWGKTSILGIFASFWGFCSLAKLQKNPKNSEKIAKNGGFFPSYHYVGQIQLSKPAQNFLVFGPIFFWKKKQKNRTFLVGVFRVYRYYWPLFFDFVPIFSASFLGLLFSKKILNGRMSGKFLNLSIWCKKVKKSYFFSHFSHFYWFLQF